METVFFVGNLALQAILASVLSFVGFLILAPTRFGIRYIAHLFDREIEKFKREESEKLELFKATQSKDLEEFKSQQVQVVEALKERLTVLTDRGRLSNEREYNALTALWEAFVEAFTATTELAMSWDEYPQLNSLSSDELERFLSTTNLDEDQRQRVRAADDKISEYQSLRNINRINACGRNVFRAREILRKKGVFIPEEVGKFVDGRLRQLLSVHVEHRMAISRGERYPSSMDKANNDFVSNGEEIFDNTLKLVRGRLLRSEHTAEMR